MSAERAFVDAILDNPDDSVNRLVFADWLEERNHPRGTLLRLQTDLALGVESPRHRADLHKRQNRLLRKYRTDWCCVPKPLCLNYSFDRGFTNITLNTKRMLGQSAQDVQEWFAKSWVHWVRFDRLVRYLSAVVQQPWLQHVAALDLSRSALSDDLLARLGSASMPRLLHLDVSNNRLTNGAAQRLAGSSWVGQLRSLDLRNNRLTDVGVQALLDSPHTKQLKQLDLHGNNLSPAMLARVLKWRKQRAPVGSPYPLFINSLGMEFVYIPAGSFSMGSPRTENQRKNHEGPRVLVRISRPFYLGRYHVTQHQYERIMGHNPSSFSDRGEQAVRIMGTSPQNLPVDMVSPEDIDQFCQRLSELSEEKQDGRHYRLATEAEWEYACRAAVPEDWPFAFGTSLGADQANFDHTRPYGQGRRGDPVHRPKPVGSFAPNAWGLYDMHGNAWDWVNDFYAPYSCTEEYLEDPTGPESGTHGILRGGSWYNAAHYCRSASRFRTTRTEGSFCISFRVAFSC